MVRRLRSEVVPVVRRPGAMEIAQGVVSHAVDALPAEVFSTKAELWQQWHNEEGLRQWVQTLKTTRSFLWFEPPGDVPEERLVLLRAVLDAAKVPYRIEPRPQRDAVIPEVVVATPAQVCQSIRQVVLGLVEEAERDLNPEDLAELKVLNEQVLARVGL